MLRCRFTLFDSIAILRHAWNVVQISQDSPDDAVATLVKVPMSVDWIPIQIAEASQWLAAGAA